MEKSSKDKESFMLTVEDEWKQKLESQKVELEKQIQIY